MAADENRLISLMGGDDPGIRGPSLAVGPMGDADSISDSSPLQIFVRAKKKINDNFVEIEDYVCDAVTYMKSVQQDGSFVKSDDAVQVEGYIANVRDIRNVLTRNHMKVAFFGRTSNGKSSVINAMLREKILPSRYGHTTNCFVQVEGSDSGNSYLVTEGSTEKQNVESVGQLADALCKEKLGESQVVRIYWPKDKCLLLRDDVVFVDSPGTGMSPNFNDCIDRYCLDADVFVFTANAESTIMDEEKKFFHKVSTRLAKPNIFILYNHWDVVATEDDHLDQVRAQHMERAVEFLVKELKVCTQKEANQRIFFVSAKESLQARLQEQKGLPAHSGALAEGFPDRYFEFQDFERKFEECISKSAVRTKFQQHSQRGKLIVSEIRQIMDSMYDQTQQLKTQKAQAKNEIHDKLNFTEQQLLPLKREMEYKIEYRVRKAKQLVTTALSEEIRFMSALVGEFDFPFHTEQRDLNVYKKKLQHRVENRLRARLSTTLEMVIKTIQREMTVFIERMSELLPAEKKQALLKLLPRREPFEELYRLDCDNLFADFHEDLSFKFSWDRKKANGTDSTNNSQQGDPSSSSNLSTVTGLTSFGSFAAAVGLQKPNMFGIGLLSAAAFVGSSILSEVRSWNDEAKEREFKQQFFAHAIKEQGLIVDEKSADCSKQVEQEMSSSLAQLCDLVDEACNDMDAEIKTLDREIKQLEEAANSAKVLQNKANYLTEQLEIFDDAFLKQSN